MDRFFVRGTAREPSVFRISPDTRVQTYDVGGHAWLPAPFDPLYRWAISDPDMSMDEIDEARAQQIIDWLHRRPAPPIPRTAAELLDELGVSEEPIDRQRKAVYKWLESHGLPDALRHDLARRGLVGPLVGDVPHFTIVSTDPGIRGILETFRVAEKPKAEQRRVLAAAWASGPLREILKPLADELRERGLLD